MKTTPRPPETEEERAARPPEVQANRAQFQAVLTEFLTKAFAEGNPAYRFAWDAGFTPESLASKLTCSAAVGTISKEGPSIRHTTKTLGISNTYTALFRFLTGSTR